MYLLFGRGRMLDSDGIQGLVCIRPLDDEYQTVDADCQFVSEHASVLPRPAKNCLGRRGLTEP